MHGKVFFVVFAFSLACGNALQCYECRSNDHCFSPISNDTTPHRDCRYSHFIDGNPYNAQYQCVSYTEKKDDTGDNIAARHCVLKNDVNFCERYSIHRKNEGYSVENCKLCETDLCNSGENGRAAMVVVLGSVVMLGFLKL